MESFRVAPPIMLSGERVVLKKDFLTLIQTDYNGVETPLDMPEPSNVLQYFTESGHKVSVRPSGTEPKIKFYIEAKGELKSRQEFASAQRKAMGIIKNISADMGL